MATGQATWSAVYPDARNPFAFPELLTSGFEPWTVSEMWIINHPDSNDTVDITQQFDRKIRALRCHASQHQHPEQMEGNVRAWNERNADAGGLGPAVWPSASSSSTAAEGGRPDPRSVIRSLRSVTATRTA